MTSPYFTDVNEDPLQEGDRIRAYFDTGDNDFIKGFIKELCEDYDIDDDGRPYDDSYMVVELDNGETFNSSDPNCHDIVKEDTHG